MELNDLVTLERGYLSWFRYPTHNIGTYLGRGALVLSELLLFTFHLQEGPDFDNPSFYPKPQQQQAATGLKFVNLKIDQII